MSSTRIQFTLRRQLMISVAMVQTEISLIKIEQNGTHKNFQTELRGLLCCLLRIFLCVCPTRCLKRKFKRRKKRHISADLNRHFDKNEYYKHLPFNARTAEDFMLMEHTSKKTKKRVSILPTGPSTSDRKEIPKILLPKEKPLVKEEKILPLLHHETKFLFLNSKLVPVFRRWAQRRQDGSHSAQRILCRREPDRAEADPRPQRRRSAQPQQRRFLQPRPEPGPFRKRLRMRQRWRRLRQRRHLPFVRTSRSAQIDADVRRFPGRDRLRIQGSPGLQDRRRRFRSGGHVFEPPGGAEFPVTIPAQRLRGRQRARPITFHTEQPRIQTIIRQNCR
ncbi:unnamed protein product [Nesidiocoris tenuis]|uniref:Uncharacterized protein n=1 Tax=Nesidiocoris tenuis TaxID=355587 RepID=A0A6H5FYN8_9HEMI|nr:unnamed protein product [Nesidiocoris tenuis]